MKVDQYDSQIKSGKTQQWNHKRKHKPQNCKIKNKVIKPYYP